MIPVMKNLQSRFSGHNFQVIQAHSAEYEFATRTENISKALDRYDIRDIPVGVDSKNRTWRAFGNMYWPKHILIDSNGLLRYEQAGYGDMKEFIEPILDLIQETGARIDPADNMTIEDSPTEEIYETYGMHFPQIAPEICLGYSRLQRFGNKQTLQFDKVNFVQDSESRFDNVVYLRGKWIWGRECVLASEGSVQKNSAIIMKYHLATRVHGIVGTTDERQGRLEIFLDSKPLDTQNLGKDARHQGGSSIVDVNWPRIYNLVKADKAESHLIEIRPLTDNIAFYTFVFG